MAPPRPAANRTSITAASTSANLRMGPALPLRRPQVGRELWRQIATRQRTIYQARRGTSACCRHRLSEQGRERRQRSRPLVSTSASCLGEVGGPLLQEGAEG